MRRDDVASMSIRRHFGTDAHWEENSTRFKSDNAMGQASHAAANIFRFVAVTRVVLKECLSLILPSTGRVDRESVHNYFP